MSDVTDFLGFLGDHEGEVVKVEVGVRANDVEHVADRQIAKLCGVLGRVRLVDDHDRPARGVAWVSVGSQASGTDSGFYVEADRATDVKVGTRGAKVRFADERYVAVVPG